MTIAHIIENEALAKRAPVPRLWGYDNPAYGAGSFHPFSSSQTLQSVLQYADDEDIIAVRFRMSDGSLCIVRPKPEKPPVVFTAENPHPEAGWPVPLASGVHAIRLEDGNLWPPSKHSKIIVRAVSVSPGQPVWWRRDLEAYSNEIGGEQLVGWRFEKALANGLAVIEGLIE